MKKTFSTLMLKMLQNKYVENRYLRLVCYIIAIKLVDHVLSYGSKKHILLSESPNSNHNSCQKDWGSKPESMAGFLDINVTTEGV